MSLGPVFLLPSLGLAQRSACIAFYLRNDQGKIINPLTGENAGQKMFFWFTGVLTLIMGVTGIMLIFRDSFDLGTNCLLSTIHGFFAIIFTATIIARIYLGAIANPGTWRALVDGKVSRKWAKKHHSEWYKEIRDKS